ncbi:hypothetical protein [Pantoea eucrina]|uniref:hypothetical protein n=1 Tax=Pantoea eucrina TaxID=472693 RepID=UPI00080F59C0|nr:hypothetical protein [Pantoea eucrina]
MAAKKENKSSSRKMLRIFLFSTLASLATVLLPVAAFAFIPQSWGDGLAYKLSYPIAAAISALYITWRIEVEKDSLNEKIDELNDEKSNLEEAYNIKHKQFQKIVIAELTSLATKKHQSMQAMKEHCGKILNSVAQDGILNYSAKEMIRHISSLGFNKASTEVGGESNEVNPSTVGDKINFKGDHSFYNIAKKTKNTTT